MNPSVNNQTHMYTYVYTYTCRCEYLPLSPPFPIHTQAYNAHSCSGPIFGGKRLDLLVLRGLVMDNEVITICPEIHENKLFNSLSSLSMSLSPLLNFVLIPPFSLPLALVVFWNMMVFV